MALRGVRLLNGAAGGAAAEWRCACGGVRYSKKHDKVSPPRLSAHPRLRVRPPPGKGSCDAPT